jgi:predicted Fe-Mo cluster-binding NifX family protein
MGKIRKDNKKMKIAIPIAQGKLCQHFGHCEEFVFIEVDENTKKIIKKEAVTGPEHAPGIIPPWVAKQGATLILAGGMGERAQLLFAQQGIEVLTGCPSQEPQKVVEEYLNGTLVQGINGCDHGHCN